ncbi:MAG: hypothetical protein SGI73_04275 [Chloroflexota bacterium]|nr:hypothetical protein [Chloroflexota bacterium]
MKCLFVFMALIFTLSACNLSDRPAGDATPTIADVNATSVLATQAPIPTRTPFGQPPPTSAILLTPLVSGGNVPRDLSAPTPLVAPLTTGERAALNNPANGATVSNPITITGTITDIPDNRFTLQLVDGSGAVLASQAMNITAAIGVRQAAWSAALTTGAYSGAAQIRIVTADSRAATLAVVDVTIQPGAASVSGGSSASGTSMGSIIAPTAGGAGTGDPLLVSGTAGNFPEASFTLSLMASNGVLLNSQTITLTGAAGFIVPWSATMGTGGYRGAAELRAFIVRDGGEVEIARVTFTAN